MFNLFGRGCCNNDSDILWFLILFLLLFWNGGNCGCGCSGNLGTSNNCGCDNDCGCNN